MNLFENLRIGESGMNCNKVKLQKGSKGSDVIELQTYLRVINLYPYKIDGDYGNLTVESVKKLQIKQGNSPDGYFGPKTCYRSDLNRHNEGKVESTEHQSSVSGELLIYFTKQPDLVTCGPTSLKMAFSYYDINKSVENLRILCKTDKNGTSPVDLVNAVNKIDQRFLLAEERFIGQLNQIAKHIKNKNPIIVQLQTTPGLGYLGSYGHYIVVTGFNENNHTVKIADPSRTIKWIKFNILAEAIEKRLKIGFLYPIRILKKK